MLPCKEKPKRKKLRIYLILLMIWIFTGFISGCAFFKNQGSEAEEIILISPDETVHNQRLQPGLEVYYVKGFWRHLAQMPSEKRAKKMGFRGTPIPFLNHRFGEGMVFNSGRARGIGLHIDGFIHLKKKGSYFFQARTNDGFRLNINGEKILYDPNVHSDRFSNLKMVRVMNPGWYPLKIQYFQRKGTSTIELYWKRPGDVEKSIVPAEALAHIPTS